MHYLIVSKTLKGVLATSSQSLSHIEGIEISSKLLDEMNARSKLILYYLKSKYDLATSLTMYDLLAYLALQNNIINFNLVELFLLSIFVISAENPVIFNIVYA